MKNFDYCRGIVHVIKSGDSLYTISRKHNVPLASIMRANPYADVYNLQIGDEICIPVTNMGGIGNICTGNNCAPLIPSMPMQPSTPSMPMQPSTPSMPMQPSTPSIPVTPIAPGVNLITYIIKDAESLKDILDKFDIDLEDFLESNNMSTVVLKPGMTINIPDKRLREEEEE